MPTQINEFGQGKCRIQASITDNFSESELDGLILDLRGNPGLLQESVQMLDFL